MLDLKYVVENEDTVRDMLKVRGSEADIGKVSELAGNWISARFARHTPGSGAESHEPSRLPRHLRARLGSRASQSLGGTRTRQRDVVSVSRRVAAGFSQAIRSSAGRLRKGDRT